MTGDWAAGYRAGLHHAWRRQPDDQAPADASADYHDGWRQGLGARM